MHNTNIVLAAHVGWKRIPQPYNKQTAFNSHDLRKQLLRDQNMNKYPHHFKLVALIKCLHFFPLEEAFPLAAKEKNYTMKPIFNLTFGELCSNLSKAATVYWLLNLC